jgi:F-type H+-transporting ATPase subunit a
MAEGSLFIEPIVELGPVAITNTVVTTWAIMAVIWLLAWSVSRRLCIEPGPVQTAVEGIVSTIENAVAEVMPQRARLRLNRRGTCPRRLRSPPWYSFRRTGLESVSRA